MQLPAQAGNAGIAPQQIDRGHLAQRDDQFRLDQFDLPLQIGAAGLSLFRFGLRFRAGGI
jgi:hypothetical protein